jgi:hypothetical protein
MPYTVAWNEAIPAGTSAANQIATFITNDKIAVRERIDSVFGTSGATSLDTADPYLPTSLTLKGASQSKIIPGSISLNIRDTADARDNLLVTDVGAVTIHGRASAGRVSPTVAATTSVDLNTANSIYLEMTVSITTLTLTNPVAGAFYTFEIKQTGAGSFTVAWPAAVKWSSGVAPTLTTTTGKTDVVSFYYNGTSYVGVVAGLNYTL